MGITDCKTARIGSLHLNVHRRALQNDLGLAACDDVFVFKRCVCNKSFSEVFGSVSPWVSVLKRGFSFLCSVCVGAEGPGWLGERGEV